MNEPWYKSLVNLRASEIKDELKVNCFAACVSYFQSELVERCLSADEMLNWLNKDTEQVLLPQKNCIFVIWSSSDVIKSPDKVEIHEIYQRQSGYPFGLIMEHAGVFLDEIQVFQKASPLDKDAFEITDYLTVADSYLSKTAWTRITFHRHKLWK